jgi:hypothetical protein
MSLLLLIIQRFVSNTTPCGGASDASVVPVRWGWYTCRDMILATGVPDDPASLPHAYRRLGAKTGPGLTSATSTGCTRWSRLEKASEQ